MRTVEVDDVDGARTSRIAGFVIGALLLAGSVVACTDGRVTWGGQDTEVDIAIVFEASTARQDVSDFITETLSRSLDDGRPGKALLPGIRGVMADYHRKIVFVTMEGSASDEEETILELAGSNPSVRRVLKDVTPAEIPD